MNVSTQPKVCFLCIGQSMIKVEMYTTQSYFMKSLKITVKGP